jgi:hypothetical protein
LCAEQDRLRTCILRWYALVSGRPPLSHSSCPLSEQRHQDEPDPDADQRDGHDVIEPDADPDAGEDAPDEGDAARLVAPRGVRLAVTISHLSTSQSVSPADQGQYDGTSAAASFTLSVTATELPREESPLDCMSKAGAVLGRHRRASLTSRSHPAVVPGYPESAGR